VDEVEIMLLPTQLKNPKLRMHVKITYVSQDIMDKIGRFDNEFYTTLKVEYETSQESE
jgi:hypothetical protein